MPPKFNLSSLKRFMPVKQEVPEDFDTIKAVFTILRRIIKPTLVVISVVAAAKIFTANRHYQNTDYGLYLAEKEALKIKQNSGKL